MCVLRRHSPSASSPKTSPARPGPRASPATVVSESAPCLLADGKSEFCECYGDIPHPQAAPKRRRRGPDQEPRQRLSFPSPPRGCLRVGNLSFARATSKSSSFTWFFPEKSWKDQLHQTSSGNSRKRSGSVCPSANFRLGKCSTYVGSLENSERLGVDSEWILSDLARNGCRFV